MTSHTSPYFKLPIVSCLVLFVLFSVSCSHLESDADRMAQKTCECISLPADSTDPAVVEQCFSDLMQLASDLESNYPSEEQQQQIIARYTQTLRSCDAPTTDLMIDYLSGEWSRNSQPSQEQIPSDDEK